jgi:Fe-S-cluster containining protein
MLTDLVQIRRMGEQHREENGRFRAWLKRHNFVERRFKRIAQDVEEATDCLACANCCRVATTRVTSRDIERLSKFIGMKPPALMKEYTTLTDDEGRILRRNEQGCVFLSGNECTVYGGRPDTCRDFPHLVHGAGSFLSRMWLMPDRATYCPIVYNSLEAFKDETAFRK